MEYYLAIKKPQLTYTITWMELKEYYAQWKWPIWKSLLQDSIYIT